jgi:hypothetical protein
MASLAELLAYKQKQAEMLNPQPSLGDRLESLSYAAGEGFADQLRGLQQLATHPVQSAKDIYSGVKYAVQNPRQAAQAAIEGLKGAVQSPESATRFIAQNFSPAELATGLGKLGTMREIVVHHGTPHRFEPTEANPLGEFNASKIGTGEGAAVYGHGIYMAENPKTANAYKQKLSKDSFISPNGSVIHKSTLKSFGFDDSDVDIMFNAINRHNGNISAAANAMALGPNRPHVAKFLKDIGKQSTVNTGFLYKADLPDEMVDRMLDWDMPLLNQSQEVKDIVKSAVPAGVYEKLLMQKTADSIEALATYKGDKAKASEYLKNANIPGIKYLDALSRDSSGTGTRNFVVFPGEEKKVKILERK